MGEVDTQISDLSILTTSPLTTSSGGGQPWVVSRKAAENRHSDHLTTETTPPIYSHLCACGDYRNQRSGGQVVSHDPFPLRARFAADIAARQAVIAGATDWREAARRLRAAGHDDAGIRIALDEGRA